MNWIKRSLWLLAWSGWAWLGVGLYRELPRDLGPVVCKLALEEHEWVAGFIDDSPGLVTFMYDRNSNNSSIRRWSVLTGACLQETSGAQLRQGVFRFAFSPRHDFMLYGFGSSVMTEVFDRGCLNLTPHSGPRLALKLDDGTWKALREDGMHKFHPEKPLVAFYQTMFLGRPGFVRVIDLSTDKTIFSFDDEQWKQVGVQFSGVAPQFLDGDRIAITTQTSPESADGRLEIWPLGNAARPDQILKAPPLNEFWDGHPSNRLIGYDESAIKVYDPSVGRVLFSTPRPRRPDGREVGELIDSGEGFLSGDGRSFLTPYGSALFDIDSGKVIWKPHANEWGIDSRDPRFFETYEFWRLWTPWWWKNYATFTVRDLKDGSLQHRTWKSTLKHQTWSRTGDGYFLVQDEVFKYPLAPNYPLLALCQTILAMPLVLLWAVLRWRRKRRARLAGVAP